MDDQNIHPIIRYGGPVLGALLVFWVISTMVSGFQTDLEEARTEAVLAVEQEAVEGAEENTEEPALVEAEAGETEDAQAEIVEPEAAEETVAEETVAEEVAASPTANSQQPTAMNALAGLPDEIAAFFPDEADPEQGAELAVTTGCSACHSLEEGVRMVGPSWYGVGNVAAERVEGQSAAEYIYTSIVMPNEYVVEGYPANVMPPTYEDILSDEQIAHLVAYLLSLEGN